MSQLSTHSANASPMSSLADPGMGKWNIIDLVYSTARIWDLETGKVKQVLTGHSHATAVLTL